MIEFKRKPIIKNWIIAGLAIYSLGTTVIVASCNQTIDTQTSQISYLHNQNMQLAQELNKLKHDGEVIVPADQPATSEPQKRLVSIGMFEVAAYCHCTICCGREGQLTASGTWPEAGRTIGVDPELLPYGTEVIINGHTYIAEDTGGAMQGRHIDIFMDSHDEALQFGRQEIEVFVYDD